MQYFTKDPNLKKKILWGGGGSKVYVTHYAKNTFSSICI